MPALDRLVKLCGLLTSDADGERATAALHGQLPEHGKAHDRALDIVLRMSPGERGDDRGLGPGHAVTEQRQHVGRDPLDRGGEVGGELESGGKHAGHDGGPTPARQGRVPADAGRPILPRYVTKRSCARAFGTKR